LKKFTEQFDETKLKENVMKKKKVPNPETRLIFFVSREMMVMM